MATSTSSRAQMPVSLMGVEERLTGPGSSGESAYIFALNIFTLPCCLLAPARCRRRGTQKWALVVGRPIVQCTGQG